MSCGAKHPGRALIPAETAEEAVLLLLTRRVRLIASGQVARLLGCRDAAATALLKRLTAKGYLARRTVVIHPPLRFESPLFVWQGPDDAALFHPHRLAWQAASRWDEPRRRTLVAAATPKAAKQFGGPLGERIPRLREIEHDCAGMTELWLHFAETAPERARTWQPEEELLAAGHRAPIPDAIVGSGQTTTAIEFAGRYRAEKITTLHAALAAQRYELW